MTGPSFWMAGAGLAFVLGLLLVLSRLARRLLPRQSGKGEARIEILSRVGLAPRQGVATIRVDRQTALVSYGEGGIRLLMELDEAEPAETVELDRDGDDAARSRRPAESRPPRRAAILRALTLGVAATLFMSAPVRAQAPATQQSKAAAQKATTPTTPHTNAPASAQVTTPAVAGTSVARPATPAQVPGASLPDMHLSLGSGDGHALQLNGPVGTVLFIGLLTLLPTLLLLMTSFTRILVVLHLLRQAIGTQTAPPAQLLAAMALILTGFVMAPTLKQVNDQALAPWLKGDVDTGQMVQEAAAPFRSFMLRMTREKDLARFVQMSDEPAPDSVEDIPFMTVAAAFVTSELTRAFQIGFALFLPFMIIDLVVASVLMSMGMFMLPPVMVSLPFKLLLFVLVDGWSLVLGSLIQSFH